ncbi:hypothetical protein HY642_00285 [Candidatus Woesearchaeota archaeon]|nr:hypothetical protein [Candidatus Woesearchaeota archaeon]
MPDAASIADRVKEYIASSPNIEARGMASLSPRAVAVMDNWDETDVYFNAASYKIIHESIWKRPGTEESCLFPPALEGTGLGVLEGVGRAPHVHGYSDALTFARSQLEPIVEEAKWYDKPVELR